MKETPYKDNATSKTPVGTPKKEVPELRARNVFKSSVIHCFKTLRYGVLLVSSHHLQRSSIKDVTF